ncbi:MAG: HAD family hydrolase [Clostridiales bacterium]|nr:HAD family hydrolase [Clostridiales bacterium]
MRISFDLDETLFVNQSKVKVEPGLKFPFNWLYKERLRHGAPEIMNRIRQDGIELWIYTSSLRTISYIKNYFKHYGVKIDRVINRTVHEEEIQKKHNEILPSKMPGKFRINLHIDDDISVKQNGNKYGFKVFLLNMENESWVEELWTVIQKEKSHCT